MWEIKLQNFRRKQNKNHDIGSGNDFLDMTPRKNRQFRLYENLKFLLKQSQYTACIVTTFYMKRSVLILCRLRKVKDRC